MSWGKKLETRILALGDTSSNESVLALANWLGFNRKHASTFVLTLQQLLPKISPGRQVVLLSVIHQVLISERDNAAKWDRLAELRLLIGTTTLLPLLEKKESLGPPALAKIQEYMIQWEEANSFGDPTLNEQLKLLLQQTTATKPDTVVKTEATQDADVTPTDISKQEENIPEVADDTKPDSPEQAVPLSDQLSSVEASSALDETIITNNAPEEKPTEVESKNCSPPKEIKRVESSPFKAVTYDFESKGIEEGPVDPKVCLEFSREIATLQIARDLRNDNAVQLSSLLTSLPEDVRRVCAEAAENGGLPKNQISNLQARDFSKRTNEAVLEMDLDEQLQNINTFLKIVERQRYARHNLIQTMIKSRCKFGADKAAEAFYEADRVKTELARRKQILIDAMELEGLDVEEKEKETSAADAVDEPANLTWYQPDAKRAKYEPVANESSETDV